jgi:ABC-type transport system involved in multi-copper enzyme maturation permease subunit
MWVLLLAFLGLITDVARGRDDLLFIFKQVAVYVVAFSVFFGGSAIYNERKSRRILAVLSKSVARRQYLSGLVLGITLACAIYCFALGLTGSWTLGGAGFPIREVWVLMLTLISSCMLAGTIALMFSTFLNPFLGAGATAALLGLPALASVLLSWRWAYTIPVYGLVMAIMHVSFEHPGTGAWWAMSLALGETILFWIISATIFSRVDIAVAVE